MAYSAFSQHIWPRAFSRLSVFPPYPYYGVHIYTEHICIYSILYTHSVCSLHTMESIEMLPCGSNCSAGIDTLIKKQTQLKIFKTCLPRFFASAEEPKLKRKLTNDHNMCTRVPKKTQSPNFGMLLTPVVFMG